MLSYDSDELVLRSVRDGAVAVAMAWETHAPWQIVPDNHGYFPPPPPAVDGIGFSLVRAALDPASDSKDWRTWRASAQRYGSPGADDPSSMVPHIHVNELLSRTSSGLPDAVELFNPNATNVEIGGWWLSDERNQPYRYKIPSGTVIPRFGFLVLDETQFGSGTNGFVFSADGDRCYLFSADASGALTGYSDGFEFGGSDRDVTFGRYVTTDGKVHYPAQITRSLGATNAGPRVGPVVISEIMYHPEDSNAVEWVEIRNISGSPVPLWDSAQPARTWGIGGPSPSSFVPTNTTLPPNGYILFLQGGDSAAFRLAHNVPTNVPIFHLFGALDNGGEQVSIFKPSGTTDAALIRYVTIDEVSYDDRFPWPTGADGTGYSLERLSLSAFGDDPANWRVSPNGSSPGRDNSPNLAPRVWAGGNGTNFPGRPVYLQGAVVDDLWPGTTLTSRWTQISGPGAAAFTSNTLASVFATFTQTGRYILQLSVTDGVFTNSDETVLDIQARPFDSWRATNFAPAALSDDNISGPAADPDQDGLNNFEEYFFARQPLVHDRAPPVTVDVSNGHLEMKWIQREGVPDVLVRPERADRIDGPWFAGEDLYERFSAPGALAGTLEVRVEAPIPPGQQQFIRLRLSLLP